MGAYCACGNLKSRSSVSVRSVNEKRPAEFSLCGPLNLDASGFYQHSFQPKLSERS